MISKIKKIYRKIFLINNYISKRLEKQISCLPNYFEHKKFDSFYTISFDSYRVAMRGLGHSDFLVYNQIFINEEYKIVKNILINLNKNNFKIIDAGANVGYTSLYFALSLNAEIISIEPSLNNSLILIKNIELNQLGNKIEVKRIALSSNSENRYSINNQFRDCLDWSNTTVIDPNGEVNSLSIDDLLREKKWDIIDLLKIDIEGAESEIFRSNVDFLEKTRIIAIEVHEEFISHFEVETILKRFGFLVFNSGELSIGLNMKLIK